MTKLDKLSRAQANYTSQSPFGKIDAAHLAQLAALKNTGAAIQRTGAGKLVLHRCEADAAGLLVPDDLSRQELYDLAADLFAMESSIALWAGDMLVAVENLGYGDISQIAGEFGRAPKTLSNWKTVCGAVRTSLRREVVAAHPDRSPLTFSHYALLVTLPEEAQFEYASRAMAEGWSVAQLRAAIFPVDVREPALDRLRDKLEAGIEEVAKKFRKAKSGREKREWIRLATEQAEYWQRLIEELKNQL